MAKSAGAGVVIVGAGHAAAQLALCLRRFGWPGNVTIVGEEPVLPYHRPPLSKDYLKRRRNFDQILIRPESAYAAARVDLMLGRRVSSIDRERTRLIVDGEEELPYEKLVLSTGASPRRLGIPGAELRAVYYIRTVADIDGMLTEATPNGHAVVIGGGYIGLEVAASLRALGMDVTVVEARERVLQRVTSPRMSEFFMRVHREEGVRIRVDESATAIHGTGRASGVELGSGRFEPATLVVIGIGILPNVDLARDAGLTVDDGIVVDAFGRSTDPDIYAAGDCASFIHPRYRRFMRLESVQNANDQGTAVARSICGIAEPYAAVPWFWSDQFDLKLQIAGLSEGYDRIIQRGSAAAGRSFALCYVGSGKLLAVDAVNRPKDFVLGKKMIIDDAPVDVDALADADAPIDAAAVKPESRKRNIGG